MSENSIGPNPINARKGIKTAWYSGRAVTGVGVQIPSMPVRALRLIQIGRIIWQWFFSPNPINARKGIRGFQNLKSPKFVVDLASHYS